MTDKSLAEIAKECSTGSVSIVELKTRANPKKEALAMYEQMQPKQGIKCDACGDDRYNDMRFYGCEKESSPPIKQCLCEECFDAAREVHGLPQVKMKSAFEVHNLVSDGKLAHCICGFSTDNPQAAWHHMTTAKFPAHSRAALASSDPGKTIVENTVSIPHFEA